MPAIKKILPVCLRFVCLTVRALCGYSGCMTRIFRLFSLFFALCCIGLPGLARAEDAAPEDALRFGEDGSFTMLLLSDTQDTQYPPVYLLRSIEALINNYNIDLVVLLGDQLEGSSPVLRLGNNAKNVEKALAYVLDPLSDADLPFAFVYGNHDYEAPLSIERQEAIYRSYGNGIAPAFDESGAYYLPLYPQLGDTAAMNLFFFESGPDYTRGNYSAVSEEQVAWYIETSTRLRAENNGDITPAVAFSHVPVAEVYELFTEVPKGTPDALTRHKKSYLPNESRILIGEAHEAPCPSEANFGLFDAFLSQGDVFLAMSGHDHVNSFIGSVQGIDLGTAPGSTYTSYGSKAMRGARLLRFYEDDVASYTTTHVRYADLIQTGGLSTIRYYLSTTTLLPNALKTALLFALLLVAIGLTIRTIVRSRKHAKPAAAEEDSGFDDDPS